MKKNYFLLLLVSSLFIFTIVQAQNTSPYWSLAGNSGTTATSSSKLGTTGSIPLNLTTNNLTRIRINSDGKVGIGTNNPQQRLHVESPSNIMLFVSTSPLSDISGSGQIGYTKHLPTAAGQRLGYFLFGSRGGAEHYYHGAGMVGYTQGAWSSTSWPSAIAFETTPAGSITRVERMRISATGNVGINGDPGIYQLRIAHGLYGLNLMYKSTGNNWEIWTSSNTTDAPLNLFYKGSYKGAFNAVSGAYSSVSDERLKTNIKAMPAVLDKVAQLKLKTYHFKEEIATKGSMPQAYGLLAQEVMEIFPHLVTHNTDKERKLDVYTMDYSGFGVIAIKAIQELVKKTEEIDELKKELADLKALVDKLASLQNINTTTTGGTLLQNSPNPVRGSTTIRYSLPDGATRAHLLVTDALGRTINTVQLTSSGQVNMDVSTLSAGVYNYSLLVEGRILQTKKMTVEK
jgi:hypothetical protein